MRTRNISAMPLVVDYSDMPYWRVNAYEEGEKGGTFRQKARRNEGVEGGTRGSLSGEIDAFAVRDAFMQVKTPADFLRFLDEWGAFRETAGNYYHVVKCEGYTWNEVLAWQRFITAAQLGYTAEVELEDDYMTTEEFKFHNLRPRIVVDLPGSSWPGVSQAELHILCHSSLEIILATLFIDRAMGMTYEACAWKDCNRLFEETSNHNRRCCSQACANKLAQQKRRSKSRASL
jgi:hypothetical protein